MILYAGPDQPEKHTESHAFLHQYPCGTEDSNQVENGLKCQIFSYISYILRQVIWKRTISLLKSLIQRFTKYTVPLVQNVIVKNAIKGFPSFLWFQPFN